MEFLTPEVVANLLDRSWTGWQVVMTFIILRWVYQNRKAKKNGAAANSNGNTRRINDMLPGNPGHSMYEVINNRLDDVQHRLERCENKEDQLFRCVARIEGHLKIHD